MYTFTLFEDIHGFRMYKTFEAYKELCESFVDNRAKEHPPTEEKFNKSNPNKVSRGFGNKPSTAELCIKRWLKAKVDEGCLSINKAQIDELRFVVKSDQIKIRDDEEIIPAGTTIEYDIPDQNKDKMVIHFINRSSPLLYL